MARCEICKNEYDKTFVVRLFNGDEHTFDSFECAIHALAPTCAHCKCRVIGHGIEAPERLVLLRQVDCAHPPFTQQFEQSIGAELS